MRFAVVALAAACTNPSVLDRPAVSAADPMAPWSAIASRARPLDVAGSDLDAVTATTDKARQAAALEAWATHGGRFVRVPAVRALGGTDDVIALGGAATELMKAMPGDDRVLEACLYLAQRMRRDGSDLLTAMIATAIVRGAIATHPHAPSFASRYAPNDDEAIRLFEAEAMAVSRMVAWASTPDGKSHMPGQLATDPLAEWTFLADAPSDRAGFVRLLHDRAARAHPGDVASTLPGYADKLFGEVDAYQAWLEAAHEPDAAAVPQDHR